MINETKQPLEPLPVLEPIDIMLLPAPDVEAELARLAELRRPGAHEL